MCECLCIFCIRQVANCIWRMARGLIVYIFLSFDFFFLLLLNLLHYIPFGLVCLSKVYSSHVYGKCLLQTDMYVCMYVHIAQFGVRVSKQPNQPSTAVLQLRIIQLHPFKCPSLHGAIGSRCEIMWKFGCLSNSFIYI